VNPESRPDVDDRKTLTRRLLAWFRSEARDLPWRSTRTPYGTWIAEVMLQQTTVAAVVPYWRRFLERYPDVQTLADADEEELLALWSGLGYYRRARALLRAARKIVAERGGRLPVDRAGWLALPGIGSYTSGAIASLGAGETVPAVDANVRRVLTRWVADSPESAAAFRGRRLEELAASLVPTGEAGAWNEALMELGALVCTARTPRCDACPVADHCRAGRAGVAAAVPAPAVRRAATPVVVGALVARHAGRVLLLPPGAACAARLPGGPRPLRDDLGGLHDGLWNLPATPWYGAHARADGFGSAAAAAWTSWLVARGHEGARVEPAGRVRHAVTRWRLDVHVHAARVPRAAARGLATACDGRWRDPAAELPVSRLAAKILAQALEP
jgi:A/G-specific adenine glycosylase